MYYQPVRTSSPSRPLPSPRPPSFAASPHGRPLPTPTPIPRSTKHFSLDLGNRSHTVNPTGIVRSPSPVKIPSVFTSEPKSSLPPIQNSGTGSKFVPLWKRTLPNSPTKVTHDQLGLVNPLVSSSPPKASGRPLPASPTPAPDLSTITNNPINLPKPPQRAQTLPSPVQPPPELESESESESEPDIQSAHAPSPQYGIRDLPRSTARPNDPVKSSRTPGNKIPGTGPRGPTGSATMRLATSTLNSVSPSASQPRPQPPLWPSDLPQLPRTPIITPSIHRDVNRREVVNLDDAPPLPLRRSPSPTKPVPPPLPPRSNNPSPTIPVIQISSSPSSPRHSPRPPSHQLNGTTHTQMWSPNIESPAPVGGRDKRPDIPRIEFGDHHEDNMHTVRVEPPKISVEAPRIVVQPQIQVMVPRVKVPSQSSVIASPPQSPTKRSHSPTKRGLPPPPPRHGGLVCGGCGGSIIGRIVSAMGARWHPACFKCTVCNELLEHVSSYEWEGRPYCHLDYHENFAPRCYHCKTAIIDERFITLDDPALGKRTYHEQHFFCAECGDPFLAPSVPTARGNLNVSGDGDFADDDVGFTVYKGHPYCEACHVRLRMPKCKRCRRSIRDGDRAVEALGGKWCWACFVCASCQQPFEDPSFFQRGDKPFCEPCFSLMLRNEV